MKYDQSVITDPGKFEGELAIVPQLWDVVLDGFAAEISFSDDTIYNFVTLLSIDTEIDGLFGVCLWERSDGFVCSEWYETEAEYDAALRNLEKQAEFDSEASDE